MTDLTSMFTVIPTDVLKLIAAFLVGLMVGAEREYHDKAAGMRTITMISVGAALFTIFSVRIAGDKDPGRIAAQIVSGIGFLGAGVIIQRRGQVIGLTTAATIWIAAALGIGMGVGYVLFTFLAAILFIVVLAVLPRVERGLQLAHTMRTYRITLAADPTKPDRLQKLFADNGLSVREEARTKGKDSIGLLWSVRGRTQAHHDVCMAMLTDPEVREFEH